MNQVIAYIIIGIGALWLGFVAQDASVILPAILVATGFFVSGLEAARNAIEKELLQLLEELDNERTD